MGDGMCVFTIRMQFWLFETQRGCPRPHLMEIEGNMMIKHRLGIALSSNKSILLCPLKVKLLLKLACISLFGIMALETQVHKTVLVSFDSSVSTIQSSSKLS